MGDVVGVLEPCERLFFQQSLQRGGRISTEEMYEVFNMGIGMVLVVSKLHASEVLSLTKGKVIGQITSGSGKVRLD